MTSRVDPILDLIDGALADPGQHSPESDLYLDVAPAMPAAGTCWRCTTHPAADGSELCAGCRSYLLEDTEDDPADSRVTWDGPPLSPELWDRCIAVSNPTPPSSLYEAARPIIITADPQVSPQGASPSIGYISEELPQWAGDDPASPVPGSGVDLADIDFSAISEAIGSFGATMAEIGQRIADVVRPVIDGLITLGVDLDHLRDMPTEVHSWDDLLTAARAIQRAAPHLSDRTPIRIGRLRALDLLRTMPTMEAIAHQGLPPAVFGVPVLVDESLPPDAFQWRPQDPPAETEWRPASPTALNALAEAGERIADLTSGPNPFPSMVTS